MTESSKLDGLEVLSFRLGQEEYRISILKVQEQAGKLAEAVSVFRIEAHAVVQPAAARAGAEVEWDES